MQRKITVNSFFPLFCVMYFADISLNALLARYLPIPAFCFELACIVLAFFILPGVNTPEQVYHQTGEGWIRQHPVLSKVLAAALLWGLQIAGIVYFKVPFDTGWIFMAKVHIVVHAVFQEVLFKGLLFKYLYQQRAWSFWPAAIVVSVLFSAWHGGAFVAHFLQGIVMFVMYYFWRSLTVQSVWHTTHNFLSSFFELTINDILPSTL